MSRSRRDDARRSRRPTRERTATLAARFSDRLARGAVGGTTRVREVPDAGEPGVRRRTGLAGLARVAQGLRARTGTGAHRAGLGRTDRRCDALRVPRRQPEPHPRTRRRVHLRRLRAAVYASDVPGAASGRARGAGLPVPPRRLRAAHRSSDRGAAAPATGPGDPRGARRVGAGDRDRGAYRMTPRSKFARSQKVTIATGILAIVALIVVLQLWLFTASMNAFLGGDTRVLAPAAAASVLCLGLNLGLLRYLYGLER